MNEQPAEVDAIADITSVVIEKTLRNIQNGTTTGSNNLPVATVECGRVCKVLECIVKRKH